MITRRLLACTTFLICATALAQNIRSAVSVSGNDVNPCTVPSPCRTFATAIAVTNPTGEIIALDSGGYGSFTIDRAVSVRPVPGAYAGVTASSGAAITVAAGSTDKVILRSITINGLAGGFADGISFTSGKSLLIENCSIDRMTGRGIVDVNAGDILISHSSVTNSVVGVLIGNGSVNSPSIFATISNCNIAANSNTGIAVFQTGNATITNTAIVNSGRGLQVVAQVDTLTADVVIENSTISGNTTGIWSGGLKGTATARVSNCTISDNTTGVFVVNSPTSSILSRLNNTLKANGTDGTFSGTFLAN